MKTPLPNNYLPFSFLKSKYIIVSEQDFIHRIELCSCQKCSNEGLDNLDTSNNGCVISKSQKHSAENSFKNYEILPPEPNRFVKNDLQGQCDPGIGETLFSIFKEYENKPFPEKREISKLILTDSYINKENEYLYYCCRKKIKKESFTEKIHSIRETEETEDSSDGLSSPPVHNQFENSDKERNDLQEKTQKIPQNSPKISPIKTIRFEKKRHSCKTPPNELLFLLVSDPLYIEKLMRPFFFKYNPENLFSQYFSSFWDDSSLRCKDSLQACSRQLFHKTVELRCLAGIEIALGCDITLPYGGEVFWYRSLPCIYVHISCRTKRDIPIVLSSIEDKAPFIMKRSVFPAPIEFKSSSWPNTKTNHMIVRKFNNRNSRLTTSINEYQREVRAPPQLDYTSDSIVVANPIPLETPEILKSNSESSSEESSDS